MKASANLLGCFVGLSKKRLFYFGTYSNLLIVVPGGYFNVLDVRCLCHHHYNWLGFVGDSIYRG